VIQSKGLLKLSPEILRINSFASLFFAKRKDAVVPYLICQDFLVKGVLIHWQVKLGEHNKTKKED
jgi:hypothetical protein